MGGRNIAYIVVGRCRASKFSRSRFWNGQEMSSVSTVLLSFSFHNVRLWLRSGLLDDAYFLVPCQSEVAQLAMNGEVGEVWHADRGVTFAVGV